MRLQTIQIIAALAAAIAFVLAFLTAGVAIASAICMIAGLAAVFWLARSLVRGVYKRRDRHAA